MRSIAMQELASGWTIETERGPDCLFIRLHGPQTLETDARDLVEPLWSHLEQHFTYRLVLELNDVTILRSNILGALVQLQKRITEHGGLMRICGLSKQGQEILRATQLDTCLAQYRSREEAVMGYRPGRPK
jgi:anti-anti-sigma factor